MNLETSLNSAQEISVLFSWSSRRRENARTESSCSSRRKRFRLFSGEPAGSRSSDKHLLQYQPVQVRQLSSYICYSLPSGEQTRRQVKTADIFLMLRYMMRANSYLAHLDKLQGCHLWRRRSPLARSRDLPREGEPDFQVSV